MAKYSEDGHLVSLDSDDDEMSLEALTAEMAEMERRKEQGIHLLP